MSASGDNESGESGPWRVRFAGTTYRVKDRESLQRLVDTGKVPGDASVQRPGEGPWIGLAEALGLVEGAVDPWSAWDGLDEEAEGPAPGPGRPQVDPRPPAAPPPAASLTPSRSLTVSMLPPGEEEAEEDPGTADSAAPLALDEAPPRRRRARPDATPAPEDEDEPRLPGPAAPRSPRSAAGKVIPFPGPRPGRRDTEGPHALATEPVPFPERAPPPMDLPMRAPAPRAARADKAPPSPGPNWWRIGALTLLGLVVVGGARFYVSMVTTAEYGPPVPPPSVPPGAEDMVAAPPVAAPTAGGASPSATSALDADPAPAADAYAEVERTLRTDLMSGAQEATDEEALETALLIELNRVRLSVARVEVTALSRVDGAETGLLESVELRLLLRSDGQELDREIAAAALVVGKYVQHDELAVPVFEVAFDGLQDGKVLRKRVDADLARQFYLGRLPMGDFLAALTK